ncbi:hypothetical protein [Anaerocolumna sp.]|uniref:hypothetical protein n=1 Tax=Anaerocolumna sp. TaxID=2041569 RepID=UPI0028AD4F0D|nr:hypothetical protein [Anaerocolumna sp.]
MSTNKYQMFSDEMIQKLLNEAIGIQKGEGEKMKTIVEIKKEYLEYSAEQAEKCKKQIQVLKLDDKEDEANLEKVKLNIYGIFESLINASANKFLYQKNMGAEDKTVGFCQDFLDYFDKIPESWRINYEKAKEYNDVTQCVIEENKLSVAEHLKNHFTDIMKQLYQGAKVPESRLL